MGELPLDIQEEILVRLKASKDLIRYRSVCKSWCSLISSRRFVESHLNHNLKKQANNNETGDTRIVLVGPSSRDNKCQIAGSCNGLVCVRFDSQVLVVNPSTHQRIKLKSLPQIPDLIKEPYPFMGFGYDSSIDDYKVVIGFKNTLTDKYCFLVLALRSNYWRSVFGELNYFHMSKSVLCNGVIHSLAYGRYTNPIIVSFDLSKEVIKEIPTPLPLNYFPTYSKLGTTKDRLYFFCGSSRSNHKLWVMKNYNVQESKSTWERMSTPPLCDDSPHQAMINYIPRKSFSGHINRWMLEEDSGARVFVQSVETPLGKDHIWLSTISECNYTYDEHVFVESLVSPGGDGRSLKSKEESFVPQKYDGERAMRKRQSLVSPDADGTKRRVKSERRQIVVTHDGDGNGGDSNEKGMKMNSNETLKGE